MFSERSHLFPAASRTDADTAWTRQRGGTSPPKRDRNGFRGSVLDFLRNNASCRRVTSPGNRAALAARAGPAPARPIPPPHAGQPRHGRSPSPQTRPSLPAGPARLHGARPGPAPRQGPAAAPLPPKSQGPPIPLHGSREPPAPPRADRSLTPQERHSRAAPLRTSPPSAAPGPARPAPSPAPDPPHIRYAGGGGRRHAQKALFNLFKISFFLFRFYLI